MTPAKPTDNNCPRCGKSTRGKKTVVDAAGRRWHIECASQTLESFPVEKSPMGPEELRCRQAAASLTNPALADALGVSLPAVEKWRAGANPIPLPVAALIRILAPDQKPIEPSEGP